MNRQLDHELDEAVSGGMRLGHVMYVPGETTEVGKLLAPRVVAPGDGRSDGSKHGIEEVGQLRGNFLPELYERETNRQARVMGDEGTMLASLMRSIT